MVLDEVHEEPRPDQLGSTLEASEGEEELRLTLSLGRS